LEKKKKKKVFFFFSHFTSGEKHCISTANEKREGKKGEWNDRIEG